MSEFLSPDPFGLSLSKPSTERSEVTSLRSVKPFDFAQGERKKNIILHPGIVT
ncbi:MAG: hypothetical protein H2050_10295 [Sphingobium sp.]|uniref:hypothetical protein n=1 Tax=Sphingobium sp. TaxID=1912891 RepID=UPI0017C1FA67|nr:hypothetical protein [Sphingobium sp.]MBA4755210.1 hypothetical protein [Sphingobium sp.]MBU1796389.1 hypothetical protein [Alphaproteobacteria bacterium]